MGGRGVKFYIECAGSKLAGARGAQPLEAVVEALARRRARFLDVPLALAQLRQAELLGELGGIHRVRQVLLVRVDEKRHVSELVLGEHAVDLVACLVDAVAIVRVDDEYERLRVLEVVPPQWTYLVLAADIPRCEFEVLVADSLDVEADGRDRGDNLAELESVQDRRLARCVETNNDEARWPWPQPKKVA